MIGALMENCYSVVEVDGLEMKVYAIKPGTGSNDHVKSLIGEVIAEPITSFTNPIHSFQGLVKDDKLVFDFELLSPASCQFQIDGGTFSDLGSLPAGMHQFSVDVSAHAPGLHTIRLKATGTDAVSYTHLFPPPEPPVLSYRLAQTKALQALSPGTDHLTIQTIPHHQIPMKLKEEGL